MTILQWNIVQIQMNKTNMNYEYSDCDLALVFF